MTPAADLAVIHTGRPGECLVFSPRATGWAKWHPPLAEPDVGAVAFLNYGRTAGPVTTRAAQLERAEGGLNARIMRAIPIGRLEAALNRPSHAALVERVVPAGLNVPPLDDDQVVDATSGHPWPWWAVFPDPPPAVDLRLEGRGAYGKPDSFYERVADIFSYLAGMSDRPATVLAEANGVPVSTVHGWVKEARRRGLLVGGERTRRKP